MIIILSLIFTFTSFAKISKDKRILKLIKKEEQILLKARKYNQKLNYRYFELQVEKFKISAKKNNKKIITSSDKKLEKNLKVKYVSILKLVSEARTKKFNIYLGHMYHAVSLLERDYKFNNNEYHLIMAGLKYAKGENAYNLHIALAEYFYNTKQYYKSYNVYKNAIKNEDDKWHTKNLYNYAWVLFKTKRISRSIKVLKTSYQLSQKDYYVDFSNQILESLTTFYVYKKDIDNAVKFLKDNNVYNYENIFKLTKKASQKGLYKDTIGLVGDLNLMAKKPEQREELFVFKMNHYKSFNKSKYLYKLFAGTDLRAYSKESKDEIKYFMINEASHYQQVLTKSFDEKDKIYNKGYLKFVNLYFKKLITINKKDQTKYNFFIAESLFGVAEYKMATNYYIRTLKLKNKEYHLKSINALYESIESAAFKQEDKIKKLKYVYIKHIRLAPKAPHTLPIYTKLFNLYLKQNKPKKMLSAVKLFKKNRPDSFDKFKKLHSIYMEYQITNKNTAVLAATINKVKAGFIKYTKEELVKLDTILANLLFEKYEALRSDSKLELAAAGFEGVSNNKTYSRTIRAKASYKASTTLFELDNAKKALTMLEISKKYDFKYLAKQKKNIEKMASILSLRHQFKNSLSYSKFYNSMFCNEKNEAIASNLIWANLAVQDIDEALAVLSKNKKCFKEDLYKVSRANVLNYLIDHMKHRHIYSHTDILNISKSEVFNYLENIYWRTEDKKDVLYYITKTNTKEASHFNKTLKLLKEQRESFDKVSKLSIQFTKEEKVEAFNKKLESHLNTIMNTISRFNKIESSGNPFFIRESLSNTAVFLENSAHIIAKIKSPIKDEHFNKQFNAQMQSISQDFISQSKSELQKIKAVEKKSLVYTKPFSYFDNKFALIDRK
ncbi:MAG: hypothetical protein N4A33_05500 [Bacteriovoracaceae bacterium]|jgi:hypothetical protein|nr:hypothetical protein [Bacteriovoracaceae bacterium]